MNLTKVPLVQHEPAILTGVSKFILQPLGSDDDTILAQTHLLIEQVLPRAEARWPRRPKVATIER